MPESIHVSSRRIDQIYAILADPERRTLLRVLAADDAATCIGDLARRIADRTDDVTAGRAAACRASLHHVHLPMMADVGVVEFDRAADRVALTGTGERALDVLERTADLLAGHER